MRSRLERELSVWIDMAMESMGDMEHYGMEMSDEDKVDALLQNINFRDKLVESTIELLKEAIRCKKIAESLKRVSINAAYDICIRVRNDSVEKMTPIHAP
ncbi:MAG: hypothetical protein ACP5TL_00485 [Candidatus Micrarchaeia archaeon]